MLKINHNQKIVQRVFKNTICTYLLGEQISIIALSKKRLIDRLDYTLANITAKG